MSKTSLKKAIATLDENQLRELITDLYAANCNSRYYLDFFADPDIESRIQSAKIAINRELARNSRGYSKARITVIKKHISAITCLQPGAEECLGIMMFSFVSLCLTAHIYQLREPLIKSTSRLLNDIIVYADRNQLLDTCIPEIERTIEDLPSRIYRPNTLQHALSSQLTLSLNSLCQQL